MQSDTRVQTPNFRVRKLKTVNLENFCAKISIEFEKIDYILSFRTAVTQICYLAGKCKCDHTQNFYTRCQ